MYCVVEPLHESELKALQNYFLFTYSFFGALICNQWDEGYLFENCKVQKSSIFLITYVVNNFLIKELAAKTQRFC